MTNGLHSLRSGMLPRFAGDKRAGVAIMFAMSLIPLTLLTGMTVDYTRASLRQSQINAAADSAALLAVTPKMMAQSDQALITAATNAFNAEVALIPGINYSPSSLSVTVNDVGLSRTVTISYSAQSQNAFGNILGQQTINFTGTSQARHPLQVVEGQFQVLGGTGPAARLHASGPFLGILPNLPQTATAPASVSMRSIRSSILTRLCTCRALLAL